MHKHLGIVCGAAVALAGCGGSPGDANAGLALFNQLTLGNTTPKQQGCGACHNVSGATGGIGPSLKGYGTLAETEYKTPRGKASAHAMAVADITKPNEDITPGFENPPQAMPENYGTILTATDLDNLGAYLLTLK
ncbi:MAG: c-type cytochrome [Myxococcaceae bacterium]